MPRHVYKQLRRYIKKENTSLAAHRLREKAKLDALAKEMGVTLDKNETPLNKEEVKEKLK